MAEITTVARPYAEAVFRLAQEQQNLARWSELLISLATLSHHPDVTAVITDPAISDAQRLQLLPDLLGTKLSAEESNFLTLILQNRRFVALPEISELFEAQKSATENQLDVQVESAFPLSAEQVQDLTANLSQQLARKITAAITVNPDLIGGVKVTVGDLVIDASLRGKLSALATSLKS